VAAPLQQSSWFVQYFVKFGIRVCNYIVYELCTGMYGGYLHVRDFLFLRPRGSFLLLPFFEVRYNSRLIHTNYSTR